MAEKVANSCAVLKDGKAGGSSRCLEEKLAAGSAAATPAMETRKFHVELADIYPADLREVLALIVWILFCVLVYNFVLKCFRRPPRSPPGPRGLPVVGYYPFLLTKPYIKFNELAKVYGNVFSFYLGKHMTVVLNDYDAVKAAYVDESAAFAARRPGFINQVTSGIRQDGKARGVAMTTGEQWHVLRRFNMSAMKSLGAGKAQSQTLMLAEIDAFCDMLEKRHEEPFNPIRTLRSAILNILFIITLGYRPQNVDKMTTLNNFLDDGHVVVRAIEPLQIFPWLRHLPGKYKNFVARYGGTMRTLHGDFTKEICSHDRVIEAMEEAHDFVEAFFAQRKKEERRGSNAATFFDDGELVAQLVNIFGAGALPVSSCLSWAFYFMVKYPNIQEKLHKSFDSVISRPVVEICDAENLPYLEAVFREIQRLGAVLPLGVPRCTAEDVELMGYHIPKGTVVLPNLAHTMRDPKYWDEPDKFDPERYLTAGGELRPNPKFNIPFSAGARQCPGQAFANDELFLFFANVMNRFTLKLPTGHTLGSIDEGQGDDIMEPPEHEIIFTPRKIAAA